jgi:hypothetical protein
MFEQGIQWLKSYFQQPISIQPDKNYFIFTDAISARERFYLLELSIKNHTNNNNIILTIDIDDKFLLNKVISFLDDKQNYVNIKELNLNIKLKEISTKQLSNLLLYKKINHLSLENLALDTKFLSDIQENLMSNHNIKILDLSYNNLDNDCLEIIANFIINSPNIVKINLSHNKFSYEKFEKLSDYCYQNNIELLMNNKEIKNFSKQINNQNVSHPVYYF